MKKIPKKVKYTARIIVLAVLLITDAKCSQSVKENREKQKSESIEQGEVNIPDELEEPEPSLETFEKLQDDYDKEENGNGITTDEIDNTINNTYEDTGAGNKAVIIDESDETMRDETKGNDDEEYDANQEPQGKVDLSSPQKTEKELGGRVVQDNTKPGGKQGVGVWS